MGNKKNKIIINSAGQMRQFGAKTAKQILKQGSQKEAVVFALQGDLGSGKTTFTQGFAKGLGIKEQITSPTFIIMKKFKIKHRHFKYFYHFDCYRIDKPEEILELGFREIINDPKNIIVIEWPERIKFALPNNIISVRFKLMNKDKREIVIV